jgi:hypothetical protein
MQKTGKDAIGDGFLKNQTAQHILAHFDSVEFNPPKHLVRPYD